MSKMNDLSYDIEQLIIEGFSPRSIAAQLGCPIEIVYDWLEDNNIQGEDEDVAEMPHEEFGPYETINS
jgi:transposase